MFQSGEGAVRKFPAAVFGAAIMAFAQFAGGAPADEVRALLEQGRSREAYELATRHPGELGKPDFDFYYGIAAVDSGHAGEGVLALERYIVRFPENDRARLELGRAYFVLGELPRAREEFQTVLRRNPPSGVQATIERFIDSIRAQETRYATSATFYVEVGGGYDSNVNSGVGNPVISVPTLGIVQLTQAGVRSGDRFLHLAAGGQFSHPVAPGVALIGGGSAEGKLHGDAFDQQFDQTGVSAYGGASYLRERNLLRATLSLSSLSVDYRRFREVVALGAEWHRQLDEFNTASVFGQYAGLEYPSSPVRDADFYGLGVGWRRAFLGGLQPVFQLQALYGEEKNDAEPVREDLSRELYTLRGGLSLTPAPRWGVSLALAYTKSGFEAPDPLFVRRRDDDYYAIELGASYRVTKQISLRADYLYSDNRSTIPLYQYSRDVSTLRARFEI
jgi:opacity protein-like surface antigen